jgi:hypothetical protein
MRAAVKEGLVRPAPLRPLHASLGEDHAQRRERARDSRNATDDPIVTATKCWVRHALGRAEALGVSRFGRGPFRGSSGFLWARRFQRTAGEELGKRGGDEAGRDRSRI